MTLIRLFHSNLVQTKHTKEYLALLAEDVAAGPQFLLVHHCLQYLAVLSGGQYLKAQLSKRLFESDKSIDGGVSFYEFEGLTASKHPKYVQEYLDKMDSMRLDDDRDALLACAKRVYKCTLGIMADVYEMNPIPVAPDKTTTATDAATTVETPEQGETALELTLEELAEYDGVRNPRILFSIARTLVRFCFSYLSPHALISVPWLLCIVEYGDCRSPRIWLVKPD